MAQPDPRDVLMAGDASWLFRPERLRALYDRFQNELLEAWGEGDVAKFRNLYLDGPWQVAGVLTLTSGDLRFQPSVYGMQGIEAFEPFALLTDAGIRRHALAALNWQVPLGQVEAARGEVSLLNQWLIVTVEGTEETFHVSAARDWRRRIQDAAHLAPREALSRARDEPPPERGLSRGE